MKTPNFMFDEPKHGWTTFNLEKYKGSNSFLSNLPRKIVRASYIGPLASSMFKVLIDHFSAGTSSQSFTYFNAEGWFWGLGITAYGPAIMLDTDTAYGPIISDIDTDTDTDEDNTPSFLIYLLECSEKQFAEDWLECWTAYKDEWVKWTICEYGEDELDGIKSSIFQTRLEQLEAQEYLLKTLLEKRYGGK